MSASRMLSHDAVVHANIEMDPTQIDPKEDDLVNSLILESQAPSFMTAATFQFFPSATS